MCLAGFWLGGTPASALPSQFHAAAAAALSCLLQAGTTALQSMQRSQLLLQSAPKRTLGVSQVALLLSLSSELEPNEANCSCARNQAGNPQMPPAFHTHFRHFNTSSGSSMAFARRLCGSRVPPAGASRSTSCEAVLAATNLKSACRSM